MYVGGELNQFHSNNGNVYFGITDMGGLGLRLPVPGEGHISTSYTGTDGSFNIFNYLKEYLYGVEKYPSNGGRDYQ